MKVKIFFILCALALILVPLGSVSAAIETPVTINTVPDYDLEIAFLVPGSTYSLLGDGLVRAPSDSTGKAVVSFSTSVDEFEVKIWLKKDGETILKKRFDDTYNVGGALELELYPTWYTPPVEETETPALNETNETTPETNQTNETIEETTPEVQEETSTPIEEIKSEKERVTAFSVQDGRVSITPRGFLYILGLIVLAVLIFMAVKYSHHIEKALREGGKKEKKKEIKVKKMSEMNQKKSTKLKDQEEKIEKAKKMIEDAQDEINKMKNPNQAKIDDIKRRLVEDEKELMRLRKEAGDIN